MLQDVEHYIVLISRNISIENGNESFLLALSVFQAILIVANSAAMVLLMHCLLNIHTYHYNLHTIFLSLALEYITELFILTVQNIHLWFYPLTEFAFTTTSFLQGICYAYVSFVLPAIMVERGCAAYFLSDYEKERRSWISSIIVFVTVTLSIIFSFWIHYAKTTYAPIAILLIINILSAFTNCFLENYNNRKLLQSTNLSRRTNREYSLAERFQIAENIKTCMMIKAMFFLLTAFNFVIAGLLIMDNIKLSPNGHNITRILFNVCVLIYGSIAILVIIAHTEPWKLEAIKYRNKMLPFFAHNQTLPMVRPDFEKDTNQYFTQLATSWDIHHKA